MIKKKKKKQIFTYPRFNGKKIMVEWSITLDQFKAIEKGNGGRAGIIPFFYENFQPYYLLNMSDRELLSDFGGGIKKKQKIYDGFVRELDEEIPKWKNELIRSLEDVGNYHLIHCIETIYLDKEDEPNGFLRHLILVICQVDPSRLLYDDDNKLLYNEMPVSKEVQRLITMSHSELLSFLTNPSNNNVREPTMNNGLQQFKRIYNL
jgi:hypothetical protein